MPCYVKQKQPWGEGGGGGISTFKVHDNYHILNLEKYIVQTQHSRYSIYSQWPHATCS